MASSADIQQRLQPFQIDEKKLDVGKVMGYAPSSLNTPNSLVVRDENNAVNVSSLTVKDALRGNLEGSVKGKISGEFEGRFEGGLNVDEIETDIIKVAVLEVTESIDVPEVKGKFIGDLEGNADTASKLKTPVKIAIGGPLVGEIDFDGSKDVEISAEFDSSKNAELNRIRANDSFVLGESTTVSFSNGKDSKSFASVSVEAIPDSTEKQITLDFGEGITKEGKEFYTKDGKLVVSVSDGGTGLSESKENHILIGTGNSGYSLLEISDKSKELLQEKDLIKKLYDDLELDSLVNVDYQEIISRYFGDYVKVDGSNSFTGAISGVTPTLASHLATKSYVDSTLSGTRFVTSVKSASYVDGDAIPNISEGDYYLVKSPASGSWLGKDNQIAKIEKINGTAITWSYLIPSAGDTTYAIDSNYNLQWNGTEWVNTGLAAISSHDSLSDVRGGNWHLAESQYRELFIDSDPVTSHYHEHNSLSGIQGGLANQYWHLSDEQYKDLTGKYSTSSLHKHSHNEGLTDSQGGKEGEKYHVTQLQHSELTSGIETSLHTHSHSILTNISGDGHYHLSGTQFTELTRGNTTSLHEHYHNSATDIQGGADYERFHLTRSQHSDLLNGESTDLHTHSHDKLENVLGGTYHLPQDIYEKLLNNQYGIKSHKELEDIQGGSENERYHLSLRKYQQIESFEGEIGKHNDSTDLQGGESDQYYHLNRTQHVFVEDIETNGIDHGSLKNIVGGSYHLTENEYSDLATRENSTLHRHDQYIKKDGTESFTGTVSGILPTKADHLATKEYVDQFIGVDLVYGESVISLTKTSPASLSPISGERYIVSTPASGSWEGKENKIATYNGTSWDFGTPVKNYTIFDKETNGSYLWNGSSWVQNSASPIYHSNLGDLHGGEWHLTSLQHTSLTGRSNSDYHYHESDRNLSNSIGTLSISHGGTGLTSIPKGNILYTIGENTLGYTAISEFGRVLISKEDLSDFKASLKYGTMAGQDSDKVSISGGKIGGLSEPLSVESGGTGSKSLNGILKGNGTSVVSAEANVDYVTPNGTCTLTNKTIIANSDGNKISGITISNFDSSAIDTGLSYSSDKIPTSKAIKEYVDSKTPGGENGKHDLIGNTHDFSKAPAGSVLVFNSGTDATYKIFETDSLVKIDNLVDKIKFSLDSSVVTLSGTQTLSNKTINSPVIPSGEWANAQHNHTSSDTGGKLTEDCLDGVISVAKGGTGLSEISKNSIIYAAENNKFRELTLGSFIVKALSSNTSEEFMSKFDYTLSGINTVKLSLLDSDQSIIPNITSTNDLNITANGDLEVSADSIRFNIDIGSGSYEIAARNYSVFATDSEETILNKILDFTGYANKKNKGLYLKDNIENLEDKSTSTLTIGGTLAILPSVAKFSTSNRKLTQSTLVNRHSSVILFDSEDLTQDYSVKDLVFTLADPTEYVGQCLYLKNLLACIVSIDGGGYTIDGETSIAFTQKYQAVTLYSNGKEWLMI